MFNLHQYKEAGPRRIRDRGINWKEAYPEKSAKLKKRFTEQLGQGAYYRWSGHDYTTNSDYFVVAGPAMTKTLQKRFFAGIKKLPREKAKQKNHYAPSGEYFSTMISALSFCRDRWGVKQPSDRHNYTLDDLARIKIPRHVKGSSEPNRLDKIGAAGISLNELEVPLRQA